MRPWTRRPLRSLAAFLALTAGLGAQGTPIGFEEDFALATDRAQALAKLIPGTEDHFFYSCLLAQHEGRFGDVAPLLQTWIQRYGRTRRVVEIENRQALLTYANAPAATYAFLRDRLGLSFDHEREVPGAIPDLPTRLDPEWISPAVLTRRAFQRHPGTVDGFRDSALASLASANLDATVLTSLLRRVEIPDLPNLPALVVRDLQNPRSGGFGSLPVHRLLTLDQLEECVRLRPPLLDDANFVQTYLPRLAPSPDVDWRRDAAAREAYLDRLQAFAQRLSPAHNSLKAHVLYHRLAHDLQKGAPDESRFLAYLRLPRPGGYVAPEYVRRMRRSQEVADLGRSFPTGFPAIADDEALVRSYLEHFLVSAGSYDAYAEYLRTDWLRRVFAETKILAGVGDMQRWYAMLDDPAYYERLRDRVEIGFAPTTRTEFATADPVSLEVDVKNVQNLLIKVFEIHTFNYLRAEGHDVDASIDLDGLVASEEQTVRYEESPLRRVRRSFDFPSIDHDGVFVVEFIGNGISSRAVIRKGWLQHVEHPGAAGHVFRVLDDAGRHVRNASIWFGGREYTADETGEIVIPYSTDTGTKTLILRRGSFSTLARFRHRTEDYALRAGIHVDREALVPGNRARILIRPSLTLCGRPIGVEFLTDPVLVIRAIDQDGVASSQDLHGFELFDDRGSVHEITVPERLHRLEIRLRGKVHSLSTASDVDLASREHAFVVNTIDATPQTGCPLLGRAPEGFVLDVLGKDGEPKADRAVQLRLVPRDYTDEVDVSLKTDARGRIVLGTLPGIRAVKASGFPDDIGYWELRPDARTYPTDLQGVQGEVLRVPYLGSAQTVSRDVAALMEYRSDGPMRDAFGNLALADGFLELRGLTPGDYRLWLKETGRTLDVRVTAGEKRGGWAVGRDRMLESEDGSRLQVQSVQATDGELRVALANANASARVHVVATRYLAPFDAFEDLNVVSSPIPGTTALRRADSTYHEGREIGDEYRYILERRFATKFPGNMLERPTLLLNPWALEVTATDIGLGGGAGGRFGGRRGGAGPATPGPSGRPGAAFGTPPGVFPDLAFLPRPSRVLANLRPGDDGVVHVPLADLGDGFLVHVTAVDDESTVLVTTTLAEKPLEPESRRLRRALDPARHLAQKRRIDFVEANGTAVIDDARTASVETFDSLATVHRLFRTLTGNEDLAKFAFVLQWPDLTAEEKRELYSEFACHELHFFLHQKDRPFFDAVVRPYLANKLDKTFLDRWLLEDDLSGYLDPWAFARLNVVERILLAQRIEGQSESIARQVRELVDLTPPDPQALEQLFRRALMSDALAAGKKGVAEKLGELQDELKQLERAQQAPEAPKEEAAEAEDKDMPALEPQADARAGGLIAGAERAPQDRKRRAEARELFRDPDPTRRYVENNYWHLRIEEQNADLVKANAFWRDFAAADSNAPFVSTHVAEAAGNFAEMMLALAVLDLPFTPAEHETESEETQLTIRAKSPLLLLRQEIATAEQAPAGTPPVLVSQNVFRLDEPYRFVGNERRDAYLTDELLVDVAYGCRVVVTNPTSSPRDLELLMQIPEGAIPVQGGFETRGMPVRLEPYATQSIEYAFYLPYPGEETHYPVNVSQNGQLVAAADAVSWNVVTEPSTVDTTSWQHVSQNSEPADVLRFLDGANLYRLDLAKIAWRMRDRAFFDSVVRLLDARHVYSGVLWSYGIFHRDVDTTREYLRHADGFLAQCGRALESPLVTIDAVERRWYEHVEFRPLFNPRAHRFGGERRILNASLAGQYSSLLTVLGYRPKLDSEDWLSVTYYLLLQDRVEEALSSFARVDSEALPEQLQYDYAKAYLDFFTDGHAVARGIAERYRDYPVDRWRARFREVLAQLDEAEGNVSAIADTEDRTRRQTDLAESEPSLELAVEAGRVALRYRNLERCRVDYFVMDVEFLFSTHPFVQQGSGAFAYVRPNRSDEITLPSDRNELVFDIPGELRSANVLVEVTAAGITRRQPYYANSLNVRWLETYGQIQASRADDGAPLPKAYVKVFARLDDGQVRFHKDGYTDLRGRFDYASLSGPGTAGVARFAVLVLSEEHGAVIREVDPPAR